MKMNDYNAAIAREVLVAITKLARSDLSIAEVQGVLQSAIQRFENDGSGVGTSVRLAEADLEEIQFTKLLDDQRPAAIFRLDELRASIEAASDA